MLLLAVLAAYLYFGWESSREKPHSPSSWAGISKGQSTDWLVATRDLAVESGPLIEEVVQWPMEEEMRLLREDGKAAAGLLLACVPPVDVSMLTENNTP